MNKLLLKTAGVLGLVLISLIYILPTLKEGIWPYKKINMGLDLQGGMHLLLEVETDKSIENTIDHLAREIKEELKSEKIIITSIQPFDKTKISLKAESGSAKKLDDFFNQKYKNLRFLSRKIDNGFVNIEMDLPSKEMDQIKKMAVNQALETIRNRIDQFGVSEPDIRMQGEQQILVQLPGVKDGNRAKELIGRTALLEFKLLDETHSVEDAVSGVIPPGLELLYQIKVDPNTNRTIKTPYLIKKNAVLTGSYLTDAKVQIDSQYNQPYVSIDFDKRGAAIFAKVTEENVNKRLAIVLDSTIYSAPVIQEKIGGGTARITGSFTSEEAHDLAIALRAGALPAPVKIIEERTVGPSLGSDSIKKGLLSVGVGGLTVVLFMLIYYQGSGLIANIALALNILFIFGGLAAFGATLTFPGIAGIILTIGMAVDANVLVFERIREELRIGKTPRAAVKAGFERATWTILDSNITTLIAALVLFQFGTGPIKGFAVTLSLGVISSVFTALYVSKLIFDYLFLKVNLKKLSI